MQEHGQVDPGLAGRTQLRKYEAAGVSPQVARLIAQDNTAKAIKVYQTEAGVRRHEAQQVIARIRNS